MSAAYGLFGYPVQHSWSPFIHGMFAKQTGQEMTYRLFESPPERFRSEIIGFLGTGGGSGANVTLPHKQAATELVNELTARAQMADAINTIVRTESGLLGDNTDGAGLLTDLTRNLGLSWSAPRILVLGAGGAARGAIGPLLSLKPRMIVIANRTAARAEQLAWEFRDYGAVRGCEYSRLENQRFDLIVNATAASLRGEVPLIPIGVVDSMTTCYDMAYGVGDTAFVAWAKRIGAGRAEQGWGMLVEQAAEAFELWRGVRPDTAPVLQALHKRAATGARSPSSD
ncbi:MAG: shikimate dehydrogenase [Steroidobacteraceae bacterium]